MTTADLTRMTDAELAAHLAYAAGQLLVTLRGQGLTGKTLKDAGDQVSHQFLMAALAQARPDDAVLSEEGADDTARVAARRAWIVDPLDGTREYSEPPRDDWAVHVALWQDGDLTAGAVARPAVGVVHSSEHPHASPAGPSDRLRLAVSRSRPPEFVTQLAQELGAELVPMGSAGVKAMSVVTGHTDAYVHAGGQYEWDSAAPVVVARAAGLHTSRLDGSPLIYNQENPWLPDLIIARPDIVERLSSAIAGL